MSGALALGLLLLAQVSVRSEVDASKVGVEDPVQLTVTVEGVAPLPEEVALPTLHNLKVLGGPSVSTQISIVNGQMSQARVYTWVLRPLAPGPAEVGMSRVRLAGGDKTAPAIPIEVVPGSIRPRERPAPADPFLTDPFGEDPFEGLRGRQRRGPEPKLFVEVHVSRTQLHVGEPLLLAYSLYTQAAVTNLQFSEAPQYPGFWAEDLERPRALPGGEAVSVGGEPYRRVTIVEKLLYPTKGGPLTIPAVSVKIALARTGFFDTGVVVARSTKPVAVTVEPIPDEPGFTGAVGRFRASAALDRAGLPLGEAATLRFRVEGSGNLKWIDRGPEVSVPGAKVYPPQVKSDLRAERSGISGAKTWEYVVVPQTAGSLELPSLAFSYYDPSAGRILRAESAPLALSVEGAAGSSAPAVPVATRAASGALALRSELDRPRSLPSLGGPAVGLFAGLVLLLHGGIAGAARLGEWRRRRAGRTAPRRSVQGALGELERVARGGMSKEAAALLIEKALHELFGPVEDGGGERERAARAILEELHFVRYAPQLGDYSETLRDLASRASEVVRRWA